MSSKFNFSPKLLALLIASFGTVLCFPQAIAQVQIQSLDESEEQELDTIEVSATQKTADEKGKDDTFRKNVSNLYLGKEELSRYRIDSAGDILKGLNGVYNMNTRTAGGAISPNIRGIAGKGRIPVTIDGTEQTIDVWLNNYGVGDRNYVDPALFRSIAVDKSPALTRGMKPGVGGSIAIRTLEASDIIPQGESWGLQFKAEGSNNSVKPQGDIGSYLGKDYRQVGGTADGAGGGTDWATNKISPFALVLDDIPAARQKTGSNNFKLNGDQAYMLAGAFKTSFTDGLIAYSYRHKGNYFAGKNGAEGYLHNPVLERDDCGLECKHSSAFIPNMAKMFKPGQEVLNSNTKTETLLLKNNWLLPDNQKIGWQYMQNDITFGEINPFQTTWILGHSDYNPDLKIPTLQVPNINSHIKSKTYKLSYEWKPKNSSWIDLEANLWRTQTHSERHQSGGMSLAVAQPDPLYDAWYNCTIRNMLPSGHEWAGSCSNLANIYGFAGVKSKEEMIAKSWMKNEEGKQNIIAGALQRTKVTREGLDISNRFRLRDTLHLTLGADIQREKLDEQNHVVNTNDLFNIAGMATQLASYAGPRGGNRQEWGVNMGLDWQATDRLNIQAGIRYHEFWVKDEALARERAKKNPAYALSAGSNGYAYAATLPYYEIIPDSEQELVNALNKVDAATDAETRDAAKRELINKFGDRNYFGNIARNHEGNYESNGSSVYYRLRALENIIPFKNGKLDASASAIQAGMLDEKVKNPQGKTGEYYKYIVSPYNHNYPYEDHKNYAYNAQKVYGNQGMPDYDKYATPSDHHNTNRPTAIWHKISEEERWAKPEKMRGHAWAPMIAMSYTLGDNHRVFARYAQMTRFPSIYEATGSSVDGLINLPTTPGLNLKPERSLNWEIGYAFNFAPYWDVLKQGDVRLTYFSNTIKNAIDTTESRRLTQYDKKITKGIELQSRIDTGQFFASTGFTYRLKQETCDADTAFMNDLYMRRVPDCIEGGFGATRFYQALQPKYSINLDLGTRLLEEKLVLGIRGIYHSDVDTKQYDRLAAKGLDSIFITTGKPYHWRPTLLVDLYGRYQVSKNLALNMGITNLTNRYYLDPMSNVPTPGPGRTVTLGFQAQF